MLTPRSVRDLRQQLQLKRRRNDCSSKPNAPRLRGFCPGDRLLAQDEEPPLGAHLVTPRFGFAHHGVYVGAGTVVHYGAYPWHRGPVEEVSLVRFAHGQPLWLRSAGRARLGVGEIVRRARSRLGENRYRLLSNNCEHFSEWCVRGEHRSLQVERFLAGVGSLSRTVEELMRLLTAAPLRGDSSSRQSSEPPSLRGARPPASYTN